MSEAALSTRWPLRHADGLRDRLLATYGDPARGYHDLRHLAEVLDRLDELAEAGARFDRPTVELAAWFHDAVYDARPAAEERSARWAEASLTEAGLPPAQVAEVARLVLLTEQHRPPPGDLDGAALSDADLGILAASPERYRAYLAGVRKEYADVAEDAFRRGRGALLAELAARRPLFCTEHARRRWEPAAHRNLAAELAELAEPAGRG